MLALNSCTVFKSKITAPDKKTGIAAALQHELDITKDPKTNTIPKERLLAAQAYAKQLIDKKVRGAIPNVNWVELGPSNQAGRSRCVWVDLTDPTGNTVWVGSVGGGLWKTTNINATTPIWTTNSSQLINTISIADIIQDPVTKGTMYISTGEAISSLSAVRGFGIYKSIDTGKTWTIVASTNNNTSFNNNTKMVITNTGALLVGTTDGLYRSTNGGVSFTKVLGSGLGITGANSNFVYDVEKASNGVLFASLDKSIHKSTDNGVTWSSALTIPATSERIEIACAPNDSNYIYLLVEAGGAVDGIYKSTDAGNSFVLQTEPDDADNGISATDFSRGQAWYDLSIAVHPTNRDMLFVGGINLFKSSNGGSTWTRISHWYGSGNQYVHADQHDIFFSPYNANTAYFTHDGGIDQTLNANAAMPTITYKGDNFNTIQFYSCAMHPNKGVGYYLAGAQDNGTIQLTKDALSKGFEVTGGDGGFCHIDQNEPQFQYSSYTYNSYRVSTDGGNNFSSVNFGNTGRFINPTDYDNANNIMYCTNNADEYLVWSNPSTAGNTFTAKAVTALGNSRVSAIYVSPNVNNRVYFGSGTGRVVRVDNANATPAATLISVNAMHNGTVSCIAVETGNDNHLLVTYSNYGVASVWETKNGGTNWANVENNLPDMPVRWALFNPKNSKEALLATELGVWSTDLLDSTNTNWAPSINGLTYVRTDMLQTRQSDNLVIAATHGRGLFRTDVFTTPTAKFETSTEVAYIGQPITFNNLSYKLINSLWQFSDGTSSTANNPTKTFTTAGVYDVKLIINNGADSLLQKKIITVLPNKVAPYTLNQGGNFETNTQDFAVDSILGTKWERGNSTIAGKDGTTSGNNAWVTGITENTYSENSTSYLYTPNFGLTNVGANYYIQFQAKYTLEYEYDGFTVEYSVDSGKNWTTLGGTPQAGWYDYANSPRVSLVFPASQAFFNVTQSFYSIKQFDVSSFSGKNIAFRFAFKTDEAAQEAGVAIDDFEIIGPLLQPLIIDAIALNVIKQNEDVQLTWTLNSYKPNALYDVQKSIDGNNFVTIATINANSNISLALQYADKNAFAIGENLYYRIKENNDGISLISTVKNISKAIESKIEIIPNPFNNFINFTSSKDIKKVKLVDVNGKVLYQGTPINNAVQVPATLPKQLYIIELYYKGGVHKQKIVKQ